MIKNFCTDLENEITIFTELIEKIKLFNHNYAHQNFNETEYKTILENVNEVLMPAFEEFRQKGRSLSPTFRYWDDCLRAIELVLNYIRAERESDWKPHLYSFSGMLPYFFVCN